jgi:hypothetical protein
MEYRDVTPVIIVDAAITRRCVAPAAALPQFRERRIDAVPMASRSGRALLSSPRSRL